MRITHKIIVNCLFDFLELHIFFNCLCLKKQGNQMRNQSLHFGLIEFLGSNDLKLKN